MIVIFLGPPGSGKGTQAAMISKELSIKHLSTGEILREYAKEDSPLGKELAGILASGKLVDSDMVNRLVKDALSKNEQNCLLDGYPRNIGQAEYLDKITDTDVVACLIDVSDEVLIKRITGRFSCGKCLAIYNKFFNPPKVEDECNECGKVEFVYRKDDSSETLKTRLKEYDKETQPLFAYYKQKELLHIVDGEQLPEEITKELLLLLKSH